MKSFSSVEPTIQVVDEHFFHRIDIYLDKINQISMCTSLLLIIFGCLGNVVSLVIFLYSNKKLPKITSSKYLILLTIVNTAYLLIELYINTLNRFIYQFKLHKSNHLLFKIYFFDSSNFFAKHLPILNMSHDF